LRSSAEFQQQQLQRGEKVSTTSTTTSLLVTEDFLKRTPERLDNVWRRCKKLTGTLVTLKRLASVQEQRIHPGESFYLSELKSLLKATTQLYLKKS